MISFILFFYLHTFSLQESQEDGRCHATTFAAISFYVLFYFYFVLYCHCCKNKLSIYLSIYLYRRYLQNMTNNVTGAQEDHDRSRYAAYSVKQYTVAYPGGFSGCPENPPGHDFL